MAVTHVVKKGETLTKIASNYKTTVAKLVKLNNIENPNLIIAGETLIISGTVSSSSKKSSSTSSKRAVVNRFGIQSDTDRTMYATWTWNKSYTENYKLMWYYATGDGFWYVGNDGTTEYKQNTYSAPSNATKVKFKVKPISKKHKVNGKEKDRWTADWSAEKVFTFDAAPPEKPATPSVELKDLTLTYYVDNYPDNLASIEFYVVKNDKEHISNKTIAVTFNQASATSNLSAGAEYKVKCRAVKGKGKAKTYSDWSDYSNPVKTRPTAPDVGIITCKATSETSVYLEWGESKTAETFEIQYTTKKENFDRNDQVQSKTGIENRYFEVTGLEGGETYYFRVRAIRGEEQSKWTSIKSTPVGTVPTAPTTWSSTTKAMVGEPLILYWVHNSEDGSAMTKAKLELIKNGVKDTYYVSYPGNFEITESGQLRTIEEYEEDDDKYKTCSCSIHTGTLYGVELEWRVCTMGVVEKYGEWSIQRTVEVHQSPTLILCASDKDDNPIHEITEFPFYISGVPGPNEQAPIGYHVEIKADYPYETVDSIGNVKMVSAGETVYSTYVDSNGMLLLEMTPAVLDLENGQYYTIVATVTMDTGLTAEETWRLNVEWEETLYAPDAEIAIDDETLTAYIRPYCEDYPLVYHKVTYDANTNVYTKTDEVIDEIEGFTIDDDSTEIGLAMVGEELVYSGTLSDGSEVLFCMSVSEEAKLLEGVTFSVYRRQYDGTFVEIATNVDHLKNTYVTDPHPSLDYARYRIVATTMATGAVAYYDVPGYPVGEKAVVIQWDEAWSEFDTTEEETLEEPPWSGSMLKLPYNIDVSDNNKPDVSLVNYIGREHPVSYYGTHIGSSATWNVEIEKSDTDTLYALRRLSRWMGDVYVREPSGSGYWANITVSFSQKHRTLTIPVTLNITRVEGGV